ncbi:MAG: hypothetical protein ABIU10_09930 [Sphingomicrobium sp.]
MTLNQPLQSSDDREVISYEAMIGGNRVLIAIDRETIEDHLGIETTTSEERLSFVNENMPVLTRCAAERLRGAPDATGIMLNTEDLPTRPA